jgi:hypothetical protein
LENAVTDAKAESEVLKHKTDEKDDQLNQAQRRIEG